MTNLRRNNNQSRLRLSFFLALFIAVSVFATEYVTHGAVRNGVRDVAAAVWGTTQGVYDATEASGFFKSKVALARDNKALRTERDSLLTMQFQNDVLRAENASLRAFLQAHEMRPTGKIAAVLSRPSVSPYSTFVIGMGTADDVRVDDWVLAAPGLVLGSVQEVGEHTALASLYSAPDYTRDVLVRDALLPYVGRGSGNGIVRAPRDLNVQVGDMVYVPESGLALGVVGHVSAKPEDAYHEVLIAPPTNLPALRFVEVVHPDPGTVRIDE